MPSSDLEMRPKRAVAASIRNLMRWQTLNAALAASGVALLAAGCAAHPEPIVDLKGVNEAQFAEDRRECEGYAKQVRIERGVGRGAAAGAVIGAAAGAISGDVGEGAGYGAIYGGARSGLGADRERQAVFKRCLRGRGYRVLN